MKDVDSNIEIVIDRIQRTYAARDRLTGNEQPPRSLPPEDMPWRFEVGVGPHDASEIVVRAAGEDHEVFDPAAAGCSALTVEAWIADKVLETHDDTLYCVRLVNTSTLYVAENICVHLEIDPACAAAGRPLPDGRRPIEIQPERQCIRCLSPGHCTDLQFVALTRGPRPGTYPVRVCITYELVYWTRIPARTQARLELEVDDDCRPSGERCPSVQPTPPPDHGAWAPAPKPQCAESPAPVKPEPVEHECAPESAWQDEADRSWGLCDDEDPTFAREADETSGSPQRADTPDGVALKRESLDAKATEGDDTMSNEKYGTKYDHHHLTQGRKQADPEVPAENKGNAPPYTNQQEMQPITIDVALPQGGKLRFSYTLRKGFVAATGKGGRAVYGQRTGSDDRECRMESIDDAVLVIEVTNCSDACLKHVRLHGFKFTPDQGPLPSGHPILQIVPDAAYIGTLPANKCRWTSLSFITRGAEPRAYDLRFCVEYDIESFNTGVCLPLHVVCD